MKEFAAPVQEICNTLAHIPAREESGVAVFSPGSKEDVAEILRLANGRGVPVEIAGAGTKRGWGGHAEADLKLATARMAGVREHAWQDLTATVGAGTRWVEMQRVLAAHGQMVALDPLWPEQATVGGVLATNDSGLLRLRYGSARDLVIGMTVVLEDGTIAKTGGKVVKNVAGYDLHKLMIGAYGTLAVVSEVTFRLHPLPAARSLWTAEAAEAEPLGQLAAAIKSSHLNPEGMQLRGSNGSAALDVQLAGAPAVLTQKLAEIDALALAIGVKATQLGDQGSMWAARDAVFASGEGVVIKAAMLPNALAPALAETLRCGAYAAVAYAFGTLYARVPSAESFATAGEIAVEARGHWAQIGQHPEPSALMREIKRQFDADRILNRGLMGGV